MDIFIGFLVQWIMPLFFILSAFSTYYALKARGPGTFIKERLKRLGIPFLLGTFVFLIPVQVYIERFTNGQFSGSFLQFYPHYFEGWYGFGGNFAWMGLHLWYLQVLLIFSLLVLPLFLLLNKSGLVGKKGSGEFFYPKYRDQYELQKDRIAYPDYFPEISGMYIDQDLIYVLTWKRQGDKIECFIFDLKGNLKKQLFVPYVFEDPMFPYPVQIKGGKLYRVIENEDGQWELYITPIES